MVLVSIYIYCFCFDDVKLKWSWQCKEVEIVFIVVVKIVDTGKVKINFVSPALEISKSEIKYKNNFFCEINFGIDTRGVSRTVATSKMELFVIIVKGWESLPIITKCSILNVAAVLDPPLDKPQDGCSSYPILNCIWKTMEFHFL